MIVVNILAELCCLNVEHNFLLWFPHKMVGVRISARSPKIIRPRKLLKIIVTPGYNIILPT